MTIVAIWLGNVLYGAAVLTAALLWGVRNRQFSDLERPRHLAGMAAEPIEEFHDAARAPSRVDRYAWLVLLVLTAVVFAAAIWMGARR